MRHYYSCQALSLVPRLPSTVVRSYLSAQLLIAHVPQLGWVLEQVLHGQLTRLSLPARVWLRKTMGNVCSQTQISVPQTEITEFPLAKCVSIFKAYTCMILTVTEGFIAGVFFIRASQEWMKANTKAFLNYTVFNMKKDIIGISFCSSPDAIF